VDAATHLGLITWTYRHRGGTQRDHADALHTNGRPFDIVRGHHVAFTAEVVMGEIAASACVSKVPIARPLSDQLVVVLGELNRPGFLDLRTSQAASREGRIDA
jgi:hypothetical protein